MRLLVVDDHEIVRNGLVSILDRNPGLQVVAQAGSREEALAQALRFTPELVLMDMRLPDGSGIEACRDIRAELPGTKVVFLTSSVDDEDVLGAILGGASGYILKQTRAAALVGAILAVGRGESQLDPAITGVVMDRVRRMANGELHDETEQLTSQERKILLLLAEGLTNREIAEQVFLSDKTVKNYASAIFKKLNLERRSQTAAFVARHDGLSRLQADTPETS